MISFPTGKLLKPMVPQGASIKNPVFITSNSQEVEVKDRID
ncbi:hypothetical protein AM1_6364 [Acaryochloris marina MBIC11017]|uniref:Uncharacterized protein n=1 Tax=Acaryochloris marina (strain MBIC 11017) TaxID=329726 RepID=B0C8N2_ACAM1|nr:hypothetical protein AM1_6364 [Acaryochloris marina MBIC11017]